MVIAFPRLAHTPEQNKKIATALHALGKPASYIQIEDMHGHDSFLIDSLPFLRAVRLFLQGTDQEEEKRSNFDGFRKLKNRYEVKKEADFRVIDNWVESKSRVLDLGCGRGCCWSICVNPKELPVWGLI